MLQRSIRLMRSAGDPNQPQHDPNRLGPPQVPAPPAPQKPPHDGPAPIEVRRAIGLFTVLAALLVFFAVLSFTQVDEAASAGKKIIDETNPEVAASLTVGTLKAVLISVIVAMVVVAIGNGLTAQALRDRKTWARPVGFTFASILLGISALSLLAGGPSLQMLFFGIGGLWGILLLARPQVRDYLQPWPKSRNPQSGNQPPHEPPN